MRALVALATDVPVDPDADEARRWLIEELSDPRYEAAKPTWFDRLSAAFLEWLMSLTGPTVGGPSNLLLGIVIALVVIALIAAFVIFGVPALNRRSSVSGALLGEEDDRTAAAMLRAAEEAAATADWSRAIQEVFRAIARGLAERTILAISPGTTAHGFAEQAATAFPPLAEGLATAATAFDRVRYLEQAGTREEYEAIRRLEGELRRARAALEEVNG